MTKQLRNLIIAASTVAVLAIGFVVILNLPAMKGVDAASAESALSQTTIKLFTAKNADVQRVDVKNSKGSFAIVPSKNSQFTLEGVPASVVSTDNTMSAVSAADTLTAVQLIKKNASKLSTYGLDKPKAVISVKAKTGSYTLDVGNSSPISNGTYVCKAGTKDVYLSDNDFSTYFLADKNYYVMTTLISLDTTTDLPKIDDIVFGGTKRDPLSIKTELYNSGSSGEADSVGGYKITAPAKLEGDITNIQAIFTKIASLSASSVIKVQPTDAQLKSYGLLKPEYTFSYLYKGKKVSLLIGKTYKSGSDTNAYIMLGGRNVVYGIAASSVAFSKDTFTKLASRLILTPGIDSVKSITVTKGSETHTFALSGTSNKLKVTGDGKKLDTQNFRNYYENLIGLETEGKAKAPAGKSTEVTIKYVYRKAGKAPDVLTFTPIDAVRTFVALNGKGYFYLLGDDLSHVMTLTTNCADGKKIAEG